MDPHANLKEQRAHAEAIVNTDLTHEAVTDHAFALAELALALDEWRQSGGFDPYAEAFSPAPGTPTPVRGAVYEVKGTITLADGSVSEFLIERDTGYQQWGANTAARLGLTTRLLEAMTEAVVEHFPDTEEEE